MVNRFRQYLTTESCLLRTNLQGFIMNTTTLKPSLDEDHFGVSRSDMQVDNRVGSCSPLKKYQIDTNHSCLFKFHVSVFLTPSWEILVSSFKSHT